MQSPDIGMELRKDGSFIRRNLLILRNYWYGVEPPHTLCTFRILFGIYALIGWLNVLPRVELYYSSEGLAFPYLTAPEGNINGLYDALSVLIQPPPPWLAWVMYAFVLLLTVLILIGWCTRTALMLYVLVFSYYWLLQLHTINSSYDRLLIIVAVVLAMSECGAVYSLDAWIRKSRGEASPEYVPIWPARLIAMQIAFMYVGTGIFKVTAPAWYDGTILQYSLQGDWGSPLAFWLLRCNINKKILDGAVLMTILLEVWAPFMLFHDKLKYPFFVLGLFFHLGIALLLDIWGFMFMPLTYVLFIEPATFKRFCERIGSVTSGERPSAP